MRTMFVTLFAFVLCTISFGQLYTFTKVKNTINYYVYCRLKKTLYYTNAEGRMTQLSVNQSIVEAEFADPNNISITDGSNNWSGKLEQGSVLEVASTWGKSSFKYVNFYVTSNGNSSKTASYTFPYGNVIKTVSVPVKGWNEITCATSDTKCQIDNCSLSIISCDQILKWDAFAFSESNKFTKGVFAKNFWIKNQATTTTFYYTDADDETKSVTITRNACIEVRYAKWTSSVWVGNATNKLYQYTNPLKGDLLYFNQTNSSIENKVQNQLVLDMTAYPNPFKSVITFNVPVDIYSLSGKKISHGSMTWNALNESNGTYIAKATINNKSITKKIQLVK